VFDVFFRGMDKTEELEEVDSHLNEEDRANQGGTPYNPSERDPKA
jgi:hypothetical protein